MNTSGDKAGLLFVVAIFGGIIGFWFLVFSICFQGISNFIPNNWQQIYYLFGSLALLLGGIWALFTWSHVEQLRELREMPSIELDMEFREQPLPNGNVLLEIRTTAKNSGVLPIRIDLSEMTLKIEKRELPVRDILLPRNTEGSELITQTIDPDGTTEITLEPMTKTVFAEYFSAEPGHLYSFKFSIPQLGSDLLWDRTQVYFVNQHA